MKYVDMNETDAIILTINGEPVAVVGIEPTMAEDFETYEPYKFYNLKGYAIKSDSGRDLSNFGFVTAQSFWKVAKDVAEIYSYAVERLKKIKSA